MNHESKLALPPVKEDETIFEYVVSEHGRYCMSYKNSMVTH